MQNKTREDKLVHRYFLFYRSLFATSSFTFSQIDIMTDKEKLLKLEFTVKTLLDETAYLLRHSAMVAKNEDIKPSDISRMEMNAERLDLASDQLG